MQRMTEEYVEAQCQDLRRMWEVLGKKMGMRQRVEADSKMLDGQKGGREVVGCVMAELAC
jgi:hypothetical protein